MLTIAHVRECEDLNLPQEVAAAVKEAVTILDRDYGEDRDIDSGYGGYVLVLETETDVKDLPEQLRTALPEYVEVLATDQTSYVSALILLGNDFGVVVILPIALLPLTGWQLTGEVS
ncbi:hypothetical protein [Sporomusa acidovorans]|uniref:Uncharacterized protein n=1 Tax=Sporomusa acidovorans (strain ATCC 49682 / DSM 3132 / Mol) TaxID=1123286 RepID=A0ABZ3JA65_SPOA4|nr:hypothetical protein [Sporomusa acidovorans]OZC22963.1 hypothetical protein SPACI_10360 [Sporomusa acidovorans DSM 3132]SDE93885.1 hypothetical protein SAMN04488499_102717 [Sporomusa acidovorans]